MSEKKYRRGVAAVILNQSGLVLACRRSDQFKSWQLPQGGVDENEVREQALMRELLEEIGTNEISVIGHTTSAIRYDWPPHLHRDGFVGQEHHYFLARINTTAVIDFCKHHTPEFDCHEWLDRESFLGRISDFRKEAYLLAFRELEDLFPGLIVAD